MLADVIIEFGTLVLMLSALLITCAVLWDVRPPRGPRR